MVILPKDPRSLGESVGQGLGSGIEKLAQMKLDQIHQQHERGRLKNTYGQLGQTILSPEENEAFSNILANTPQEEHSALMQILPQMFEARRQQSQQQSYQQQMGQPSSVSQSGFQNFIAQQPQPQDNQQRNVTQPMNVQQQQPNPLQILSRGFETPALRLRREEMAQKQDIANQKLASQENYQSTKLKEPYAKEFKQISDNITSADRQIEEYNQIIEAANSGELVAGPVRAFLESKNAQDIFTNPLTALTEKNVKNAFNEEFKNLKMGGRPAAFIFSEMSKGWPSLRQYPEAMAIVAKLKQNDVKVGKLINEKYLELATKYDQANKNYPPTMRNQAAQLVQKQTDALTQEAKHYYDNKVADILIKQKNDMGGGYTGKRFNTFDEAINNLTPGNFIKNRETGETFGKDSKGVYAAKYINGNWQRERL